MINYVRVGSLLDSLHTLLVNPVNCRGVMGAGLAAEFKRVFPSNFAAYEVECLYGRLKPGRMFVTAQHRPAFFVKSDIIWRKGDPPQVPFFRESSQVWVANFPTKDHWKQPSQLSWIREGLADLVQFIVGNRVQSVALPALGCGLGGLEWVAVKAEIERAFSISAFTGSVDVYLPKGRYG